MGGEQAPPSPVSGVDTPRFPWEPRSGRLYGTREGGKAKIRTPPACPTESSLSVPRDGWEESQVFSQLLLSLPSEKTYMSLSPEGNAIFSPGELRPVLAAVVVVVVNLYW